jgi:predicted nucleic acid-binding Zn ribbon protein
MTHGRGRAPERLSQAVTELIALRGWAQVQGHARLNEAWKSAAGASVAAATRVLGIRRSVLQVAVGNSPLLSELAAYHKSSLLAALARECPELKVRDLKFVLKGNLPAV